MKINSTMEQGQRDECMCQPLGRLGDQTKSQGIPSSGEDQTLDETQARRLSAPEHSHASNASSGDETLRRSLHAQGNAGVEFLFIIPDFESFARSTRYFF